MSRRKAFEWKCLRCNAEQAWINRNRTRCMRCNAGREWLEQVIAKSLAAAIKEPTK